MNEKVDVKKASLDVRGSPTRCPYCHEDATAAADVWVCQDCLARHHVDCWRERGACSSCSSVRHLEPPAREALTPERAREALVAAGYDPGQVDRLIRSSLRRRVERYTAPTVIARFLVAFGMALALGGIAWKIAQPMSHVNEDFVAAVTGVLTFGLVATLLFWRPRREE
jgi:hypothetical protein